MLSLLPLVPTRRVAILVALAGALCLLAAYSQAQSCTQPKDEIFGGYSWLHPNGYADLGFKVENIAPGFDISNTYYLPGVHNLGLVVDGSGHFHGGTNPVNPVNGGNKGTSAGYILGGLQYKYHAARLSPFVRGFLGTADLSPDCCGGTKWSFAGGGGGGLDLGLTPMVSIRLAQVDYIYSKYDQTYPSGFSNQWNSVRLAAGIVLCLGCSFNPPPLSCAASAAPAEVWAGDPVNLTTAGTNFNPKHPITYGWTANGGKLSTANTQTATIDTAGMAPGSYSATSTITDPKMKKLNSATCSTSFGIRQPHPPVVSCSVNPPTIAIGESANITMTASDPDGRPLTYKWSATGGTLSSSGTTATVTATNADAGNTITISGTASDDRTPPMSSSCTAMVTSPAVQKCVNIEDWGECTFEKNPKKPWRVDNDCKDTLDKVALRVQQMPNGKLDVVGYTNQKEVVSEQTLGAQRSVNVKYYLTTDGPTKVDPGRIQPRQGGTKGEAAHFYFVPEGPLCGGQAEEGTVVEETVVKGQSRTVPAQKKGNAKPAAPAQ